MINRKALLVLVGGLVALVGLSSTVCAVVARRRHKKNSVRHHR